MKTFVDNIRLQFNESDQPEVLLSLKCHRKEAQEAVSKLREILAKGKPLAIEMKQYRQKRSLDANAYMWVLLSKMAEALHTTKNELYLQMLDRYGVFTHIVVKESVVDRVKEEWRTVRELGKVTVNGKDGVQLQCYFGSSTYDTKEMSVLIDGLVSECKELNIETMPPAKLDMLKQIWGI